MSKLVVAVIAALLFLGGVFGSPYGREGEWLPSERATSSDSVETVARVIDGDTLDLASSERVRLVGIDAPEREECYYEEARRYLEELVAGKTVRLELDESETDKYDRLLRYVYVPATEGVAEDVFVNEALVRAGMATTLSIPPDNHFQAELAAAEVDAKAAARGLWGACN